MHPRQPSSVERSGRVARSVCAVPAALWVVAACWSGAALIAQGLSVDLNDVDGPPPATCLMTDPVFAHAPSVPNTSPVSGYWHRSEDLKLWAPSLLASRWTTGIGRYWVRPAGTPLRFVLRRLDAAATPVDITEDGPALFDFFFGGPPTPTDGCWEATVTAGPSRVTFVVALRDTIDRFAGHQDTRVSWSKESGRVAHGDTSVVVTALALERPGSFTGRLRGARIDLTNPQGGVTLYEDRARLIGTGSLLDRLSATGGTMIYGLGRTFNVRASDRSLEFVGQGRVFNLGDRSSRDFATLLVRARQDLESASR